MASGWNTEYDAFRGKIGDISNAVAGHGLPGITAIANALFERKLITENDHQAVISTHDTPIKVVTTMLNSLLTRIKYNPSTYSEVLEVFKNNELEYIANMLEATRLPAASPTLASPTLASPMLALAPVVNPGILYTMYLVQYQTCIIYYYFRTLFFGMLLFHLPFLQVPHAHRLGHFLFLFQAQMFISRIQYLLMTWTSAGVLLTFC